MMMRRRGHHRTQSIHPGKALATQRRWYFGRPVVVRAVGAVEGIRIGERLGDETVQAGRAKAGLEVRRGLRGGVHRVALFLPPFRPSVLEPDLEIEERNVPGDTLTMPMSIYVGDIKSDICLPEKFAGGISRLNAERLDDSLVRALPTRDSRAVSLTYTYIYIYIYNRI